MFGPGVRTMTSAVNTIAMMDAPDTGKLNESGGTPPL